MSGYLPDIAISIVGVDNKTYNAQDNNTVLSDGVYSYGTGYNVYGFAKKNNNNIGIYHVLNGSNVSFTINHILLGGGGASASSAGGINYDGGHALSNFFGTIHNLYITTDGALLGGGGAGTTYVGPLLSYSRGGYGGPGGGGGGGGYQNSGDHSGGGGSIISPSGNGYTTGSKHGSGGGGPGGGLGGKSLTPENTGGNGGTYINGLYRGTNGSTSESESESGSGGGYGGGNGSAGGTDQGLPGGGGGGGGSPGNFVATTFMNAAGKGGYGLFNQGLIKIFHNSQGGNNIYGPLFLGGSSIQSGSLESYRIVIKDHSRYGQLFLVGYEWPGYTTNWGTLSVSISNYTSYYGVGTVFEKVIIGNISVSGLSSYTLFGTYYAKIIENGTAEYNGITYKCFDLNYHTLPSGTLSINTVNSTSISVTINVTVPGGNGLVNIYTLQISQYSNFSTLLNNTPTSSGLTYTYSNLSNGTLYYIRAKINNGVGDSDFFTNSATTYNVPSAPSVSLTQPSASSKTITATVTQGNNNGSAVDGYYYAINGGAYSGLIANSSSTFTFTFNVTEAYGTSYYINVILHNGVGNSEASGQSNLVITYTTPSAPSSLGLIAGFGSIEYTIGAVSPNGSAIDTYDIKINTGGYYNIGNVTTGIIYNLANDGSTYTVYARANNDAGNGAPRNNTITLPAQTVSVIPTKNYFFYNGNSLDTIFALNPSFNGTTTTNYQLNGIDIGKRYLTGNGASATNYKINAADLNATFLKTNIASLLPVDKLSLTTKNAILPNSTTANTTILTSAPTAAASISAGVYGCKLLFASYTGPVMTIRESTKNTIGHFYANSDGTLVGSSYLGGGTSLATWLNGAIPYVQIWWDQTGNGNHAYQFTTGSQPKYDTTNKFIIFDSTYYFNLPDKTHPWGDSQYTYIFKCSITANDGGIFGGGTAASNQSNSFRRDSSYGYRNYWYGVDIIPSSDVYDNDSVISLVYNGSTRYMYKNKSIIATLASSGRQQTEGNNTIGRTSAAEYMAGGYIQYMYIIPIAISDADRVILENT